MKSNSIFDLKVYKTVNFIPYGRVTTYGHIAELMGAFGCARQVGWSLRRLKLPSKVPWYRVINSKGMISMSVGREGTDWIQIDLLKKEGIFINDNFKINLNKYFWKPHKSLYIK